jgi:biopolymer transport protein ExbD
MNPGKHGSDYFNEINLTPLLDLAFVLLIIFIITNGVSPLANLPVQLPESSSAANAAVATNVPPVLVGVDREGWYVGSKQCTLPQLREELKRLATGQKELRVEIQGDARVEYQRVIETLDALQEAGITSVGLTTEPLSGNRGPTQARDSGAHQLDVPGAMYNHRSSL